MIDAFIAVLKFLSIFLHGSESETCEILKFCNSRYKVKVKVKRINMKISAPRFSKLYKYFI